jgi:hypothetical protein
MFTRVSLFSIVINALDIGIRGSRWFRWDIFVECVVAVATDLFTCRRPLDLSFPFLIVHITTITTTKSISRRETHYPSHIHPTKMSVRDLDKIMGRLSVNENINP